MSKQQRPPQRATEQASAGRTDVAREHEPSVGEQAVLGNQALAAQLEGGASAELGGRTSSAGPLESARAEALPRVERGILALSAEPRSAERVDRFVAVLESSKLPADRKSVLIEKLTGDQEAAVAVERAAERWFGGVGEQARQAGLAALDGVWDALIGGSPTEAGWRVGDREIALTDEVRSGAPGERAEHLVAELASSRDPASGEAVRGFCREVYLIVAWHEEDEDDELISAPAPELE